MPRKGGAGGNEIFPRKPALWPSVEELLAFALKDAEAPEDAPPPGLPELLARRDAALRFVAQAEKDEVYPQLRDVIRGFDIDLGEFLADLPRALAAEKQFDDALDLMRKLQPLLFEVDVQADLAMLLAEAGRTAEAMAEVEKNLREASDAWTFVLAADVLRKLGEKTRAQALYRKAQVLSDNLEETCAVIEREIPLLEELGRTEEVKALREALEDRRLQAESPYPGETFEDDEDFEEQEEEFIPEPARAKPEPARNAPCPCGSGKKYKRCCGKAK